MTMHTRARSPLTLLLSTLLIVSLLLTTAGSALAAPQQPSITQQQPTDKLPADPSAVQKASPSLQETTNILLLGSDRRPNTPNWRTDVMMIIAIDEATKQVGCRVTFMWT
jgi:anionic cell wall polymer biosynthesis LytR-Cps2A-Psr (LCP) family protein